MLATASRYPTDHRLRGADNETRSVKSKHATIKMGGAGEGRRQSSEPSQHLRAQKFSGSLLPAIFAFARASVEIVRPTKDQSVELNDAAKPTTCGNDVGAVGHSRAQLPCSPQALQSRMPWHASWLNANLGSPIEVTLASEPPKFMSVSWPGNVLIGSAFTRASTRSAMERLASHQGRPWP